MAEFTVRNTRTTVLVIAKVSGISESVATTGRIVPKEVRISYTRDTGETVWDHTAHVWGRSIRRDGSEGSRTGRQVFRKGDPNFPKWLIAFAEEHRPRYM